MRIAVYDTATGAIHRLVLCPEQSANLQAGNEDEAWVVVGDDVSDTTHEIVGGQAVPR